MSSGENEGIVWFVVLAEGCWAQRSRLAPRSEVLDRLSPGETGSGWLFVRVAVARPWAKPITRNHTPDPGSAHAHSTEHVPPAPSRDRCLSRRVRTARLSRGGRV